MDFDQSSNLAGGTEYTATVRASARDKAGNTLGADKVWKFKIVTTSTVYPSSTTIVSGTLRSGDASRLLSDDNAYYQVNSTTSGTRVSDWYGRFNYVSNSLTSLKLTYRGAASTSCSQVAYVYNWTTGSWVTLNSRTAGTSESEFTVAPGGTLADYVSGTSGDGDVLLRVRCTRSDSVNFYTAGELMRAVFTKP